MDKHEEIVDFNAKLLKIANTSYFVGEKTYQEELVRKILRSLSEKFLINVRAIEQ